MSSPALDPAAVVAVLSRFSDREQAIYRLVVMQHRSVADVALRAELTEAAVRRIVLTIRQALRELDEPSL